MKRLRLVPVCIVLLFALSFVNVPGFQTITISLQPFLSSLTNPVFITNAGDGRNRLFVVEQSGLIKVVQPGATSSTIFLDLTAKVLSGGEQGLLGLAFHPSFETNRRFFVNYTRKPDGATVVAQYRVSLSNPNLADPAEKVLLTVMQPFTTHNAGMMAFGSDGFLYIAMGDGGAANDPGNRAQNIDELLGKILRIDVDAPTAAQPYSSPPSNPFFGPTPGRDEIFAVGFRNPWRFSFDRTTGNLLLGDVGQNVIEEVDVVTLGGNYGWRVFEGTHCTPNDPSLCNPAAFIAPIGEYAHDSGRCSITGGYAYRGPIATLPDGTYVFGDFCTGEIFRLEGSQPVVLLDTPLSISSFGEDEAGELYVVGLGGTVHRIVNPNASCSFAINPVTRSFTSAGGTGSIAVTAPANCNWTALSNDGWIDIVSGGFGSGFGAVSYSVEPNDNGAIRSGSITAAGKTLTVTQAPAASDTDQDEMPDDVEVLEGANPALKDNDVFANARLFAMQQYRDFVGREGDPGGIDFWSEVVQINPSVRPQVIESFFNSPEVQNLTAPIIRLYFATFLRIPDCGGLDFWVGRRRAGVSLAAIAQAFAQSAEFLARYGDLDNEEFVTLLYNNILMRQPDSGGLAFWTGLLNNGTLTRGQVLLAFSESSDFRSLIESEVFVMQVFRGMLGRCPGQAEFDFWVMEIDSGMSRQALITDFFGTAEYHDRFLPPQ